LAIEVKENSMRLASKASTRSWPSLKAALMRAGSRRDRLEVSELHSARGWFERQGYSIAVSNGYQQVDSGTKMIQLGKNTSSGMPPLPGASPRR
jgi:hypothetical protein